MHQQNLCAVGAPAAVGMPCWTSYPLAYFLDDSRCFFSHFTFRVAKHTPPHRLQSSVVSSVASLVFPELLVPEGEVVRRLGVVFGTPVPETSVDEDCDLRANEAEIRPGAGDLAAQPVSQTCTPKRSAKPQFRLGVAPTDGLHDPSAFFGRERVGSSSSPGSQDGTDSLQFLSRVRHASVCAKEKPCRSTIIQQVGENLAVSFSEAGRHGLSDHFSQQTRLRTFEDLSLFEVLR